MKVLILGAGRVGGSLARALVNNGYDVAIIDQDKNALNSLEEKLDILTIEGHASHDSYTHLTLTTKRIV